MSSAAALFKHKLDQDSKMRSSKHFLLFEYTLYGAQFNLKSVEGGC